MKVVAKEIHTSANIYAPEYFLKNLADESCSKSVATSASANFPFS
jgi:hypothetical protein